jgi:hypothetical protein
MKIFLSQDELNERQKLDRLKRFRARPYTFLFMAILAQLLVMPLMETRLQLLVPLMTLLIVITVVQTLDVRKAVFRVCLALGIAATMVHVTGRMLHISVGASSVFVLLGLILSALFMLIVISILMLKVFSVSEVTARTLRGGIAVYVLMGFLWANIYGIVLWFNPGAITFPEQTIELSSIIYFSFTSLTTLGYGDITPVSWMARNLTIIETTIGQIYLTVLVARLVGLYLARLVVTGRNS